MTEETQLWEIPAEHAGRLALIVVRASVLGDVPAAKQRSHVVDYVSYCPTTGAFDSAIGVIPAQESVRYRIAVQTRGWENAPGHVPDLVLAGLVRSYRRDGRSARHLTALKPLRNESKQRRRDVHVDELFGHAGRVLGDLDELREYIAAANSPSPEEIARLEARREQRRGPRRMHGDLRLPEDLCGLIEGAMYSAPVDDAGREVLDAAFDRIRHAVRARAEAGVIGGPDRE